MLNKMNTVRDHPFLEYGCLANSCTFFLPLCLTPDLSLSL